MYLSHEQKFVPYSTVLVTRMVVVLALILFGPESLFGQWGEETILDRSFSVKSGGTLHFKTDRGSVEVKTGDSRTVQIVGYSGNWTKEEVAEAMEFTFDELDDGLRVRGEFYGSRRRYNRLDLHFVITLPHSFNLDLSTSGGTVEIASLDGDVALRTSGGSVDIGEISGKVIVKSSGGSIHLEGAGENIKLTTSGGGIVVGRVGGEVLARTSGGSIRIDEAGGAIDASTSGGSITAAIVKQPTADSRLESSGGGITLYLADNIGVNIQARSSGGSVRSEHKIASSGRRTTRRLRGTINEGGPSIEMKSSGGPIRIRRQ